MLAKAYSDSPWNVGAIRKDFYLQLITAFAGVSLRDGGNMKKISLRRWLLILGIALISINAVRLSGNPKVFPGFYIGLVIAYLGIILIGLISDKIVGAIAGGLITFLGLMAKKYVPVIPKLKKAQMNAFLEELNAFTQFLIDRIYIFIFIGIIIGFLAGLLAKYIRKDDRKLFTTVSIAHMSIFVALSVIINTLRVGSVSFGGFPIIFSGYLLGPLPGFIVGGVADLLGFLIRPSSFPFNPLFTLTSALTGAIPIIVTKALGEKYPDFSLIKVLIGIFIGQMLTSVILVPIFSFWLYGANTLPFLMGKAFAKQIVSIPIYAVLLTILNERLSKVIDFRKIFN